MNRVRLPTILTVLLAFNLLATPREEIVPTEDEEQILSRINQFRSSNKRAPLRFNKKLIRAARYHANNMADCKELSHELKIKVGRHLTSRMYVFHYLQDENKTAYGECVASQRGSHDHSKIVEGWKKSEGHRTILLGHFKDAGIGIAQDSSGEIYYCFNAGRIENENLLPKKQRSR
ncbi:MAG: CAP domain-containing protein [Deltaproteobacteria bacterium]|nr:CAP domain-containing protein [Deltaproteobacteria bacterium]